MYFTNLFIVGLAALQANAMAIPAASSELSRRNALFDSAISEILSNEPYTEPVKRDNGADNLAVLMAALYPTTGGPQRAPGRRPAPAPVRGLPCYMGVNPHC